MNNTPRLVKAAVCGTLLLFFAGKTGAKEPKTIITGAQMEITGSGKTVVFSGGARVNKGTNELTADKIIQDKKNNRVEAYGSVVFKSITQDGEPLRGSSQKAYYDLNGERGELFEGKPEILYYMKTSTSPVSFRADNISFDTKKEELYGRNNAEIITSSVTAYAPNAVFVQKDKKIVLTGPEPQPLMIYYEGSRPNKYRADKITFFTGGGKVLLKGHVRAIMTVEDKKAGGK